MVARRLRGPDATLHGVSTAPKCGLLVLAHVPKTGGSTITEVLQTLPGWDFLGRPKSGHPHFFAAFGDLFDKTRAVPSIWRYAPPACREKFHPNTSAIEGSGCGGLLNWRERRIVVDFHEPIGVGRFHDSVLPRLGTLRARYRAAGCPMAVGTVLREPSSQMLSEFLYFHVAFHPQLHGNVSLQESVFVNRWLPGRANPQLAWMRNSKCSYIGSIFLCSTPYNQACGHNQHIYEGNELAELGCGEDYKYDCNASGGVRRAGATSKASVSNRTLDREAKATAGALRMLRHFDVVGTTSNVGEVMWAMLARAGYFFNETTVWRGTKMAARLSSPGDSARGSVLTERAPTLGTVFRCNPPGKGGRLSLSSMSADTLRRLRAHSRCDRVLYEAALLREREELAFTARLARWLALPGIQLQAPPPPLSWPSSLDTKVELLRQQLGLKAEVPPAQVVERSIQELDLESNSKGQSLRAKADACLRTLGMSTVRLPSGQEVLASPPSLYHLYESGAAHRAVVRAGVASTAGLANVEPALLQSPGATQLARRFQETLELRFSCKVAGNVKSASQGTEPMQIPDEEERSSMGIVTYGPEAVFRR